MKHPLLLTLAAYGLGCVMTIGAPPGADVQIKLDPAMAGAEFEGIGAVSAGAFEIAPTLWAVAHITQFAEPGWRFLDSVSHKPPKGGSVVGFVAREGGGQCLRQQVHRPGIDWAKAPYSCRVIGDDRWNDIEISAEASLELTRPTLFHGHFFCPTSLW